MAEEEEYDLTAGKFQRLCGTTRETLRYYRQQGLLVPYVNPRNGYTMYSSRQVTTFYVVHMFRELGYSVSQISELLDDKQSFSDFISLQQETLLRQRKELDEKIAVIGKIQYLLDIIHSMQLCVPQVISLPDKLFIRTTSVETEKAASAGEIVNDLHRHLGQMAGNMYRAIPMGVAIGLDNFAKRKYIYDSVFSLSEHGDTDVCKLMNITDKTNYAAAVAFRDDSGETENIYSEIWDFIHDNELSPVSDVYILNVLNAVNRKRYHHFIKLMLIPVKKGTYL